jgi:hypothetical protein
MISQMSEGMGKARFQLEVEAFVTSIVTLPYLLASSRLQSNGFIAPFVYHIMEDVNQSRETWNGGYGSQEVKNFINQQVKGYTASNSNCWHLNFHGSRPTSF